MLNIVLTDGFSENIILVIYRNKLLVNSMFFNQTHTRELKESIIRIIEFHTIFTFLYLLRCVYITCLFS